MKNKEYALAPIGISTYKRLNHLKETIESLRNNYLADQSELYVFSDGPKKGDEKEVAEIREYLKTISGFNKIHIIERRENDRVFNNRNRQKVLLEKYGKAIFLEEDVVTSPGFLNYMNWALQKFENNKNVASITGYCPNIDIPDSYEADVFLSHRFTAWGYATWKNEYDNIKYISKSDYWKLYKNKAYRNKIRQFIGDDFLPLLKRDSLGIVDALDVKFVYYQLVNDKYTVYPRKTLVKNIGLDGSGEHCPVMDTGEINFWNKDSNFNINKVTISSEIQKLFCKVYKFNLKKRVIHYLNNIWLFDGILYRFRKNIR